MDVVDHVRPTPKSNETSCYGSRPMTNNENNDDKPSGTDDETTDNDNHVICWHCGKRVEARRHCTNCDCELEGNE